MDKSRKGPSGKPLSSHDNFPHAELNTRKNTNSPRSHGTSVPRPRKPANSRSAYIPVEKRPRPLPSSRSPQQSTPRSAHHSTSARISAEKNQRAVPPPRSSSSTSHRSPAPDQQRKKTTGKPTPITQSPRATSLSSTSSRKRPLPPSSSSTPRSSSTKNTSLASAPSGKKTPPTQPASSRTLSVPSAPPHNHQHAIPSHKRAFYGAVALMSVFVLILSAFMWNYRISLESGIVRAQLNLGGNDDGAVDILLVGVDSRTDAQGNPLSKSKLRKLHANDSDPSLNTDTIILLRIPYDGTKATAISFPRDTYVDIPNIGKAKLNSAYGSVYEETLEDLVEKQGVERRAAENEAKQAGRKSIISTLEKLTGITIDHYAEIGLAGFADLTDALGGVKVCLRHNTRDKYSGSYFRRGVHRLNGTQALSFVRQRHGLPRGDIDRIKRQQVFMAYLTNKLLSSGTLTDPQKINDLLNTVKKFVVLDEKWDIADFANRLTPLATENVTFSTIPIENLAGWNDSHTQSVVRIDPEKVHNWVASLTTNHTKDGKQPVDVFNTGTTEGLAHSVSVYLQSQGYPPGTVSNAPDTTIHKNVVRTRTHSRQALRIAHRLHIPVHVDASMSVDNIQVYINDTYQGPGTPYYTGTTDSNNTGSSASHQPGPNAVMPAPISAHHKGPQCVN